MALISRTKRFEALFEAGCDDAVVGSEDGIHDVDFDRDGPFLDRAVMAAVADVEQLEGVESLGIGDAGLASMAHIAKPVGRSRKGVRLLVTGARGPGGIPAPVTDPRSRYRRWRWRDVSRWFAERRGEEIAGPRNRSASRLECRIGIPTLLSPPRSGGPGRDSPVRRPVTGSRARDSQGLPRGYLRGPRWAHAIGPEHCS